MGKRKRRNGDEQDAFSQYARHLFPYLHKPGVRKSIKRQANKRERKEAKKELND